MDCMTGRSSFARQASTAALYIGIVGRSGAANGGSPPRDTSDASDWSGSYIGLQLGYGKAKSRFVDSEYNGVPPYPTVAWDVPSDGWISGLQAGHQWQHNHLVYGVEGELGRLDLDGERLQPGVDPFGIPYDATGIVRGGWFGGMSVRVGYAQNRTLFYGKVGGVYSNAKFGFSDTCVIAHCGTGMADAWKELGWGYQLGAGVEYALSQRWTVKTEYDYMDFGETELHGHYIGGGQSGTPYKVPVDLSAHTVKLGVNYRF